MSNEAPIIGKDYSHGSQHYMAILERTCKVHFPTRIWTQWKLHSFQKFIIKHSMILLGASNTSILKFCTSILLVLMMVGN